MKTAISSGGPSVTKVSDGSGGYTDWDGGLTSLISGEDQTNDVLKTEQRYPYVSVGPSTTVVLGTTGAAGDYLHTVTWRIVAGGTISIKDDTTTVFSFTGNGAPTIVQNGTFTIDAECITNWTITNTAGCQVLCTGRFT